MSTYIFCNSTLQINKQLQNHIGYLRVKLLLICCKSRTIHNCEETLKNNLGCIKEKPSGIFEKIYKLICEQFFRNF